jgi:hypothetical protein
MSNAAQRLVNGITLKEVLMALGPFLTLLFGGFLVYEGLRDNIKENAKDLEKIQMIQERIGNDVTSNETVAFGTQSRLAKIDTKQAVMSDDLEDINEDMDELKEGQRALLEGIQDLKDAR